MSIMQHLLSRYDVEAGTEGQPVQVMQPYRHSTLHVQGF